MRLRQKRSRSRISLPTRRDDVVVWLAAAVIGAIAGSALVALALRRRRPSSSLQIDPRRDRTTEIRRVAHGQIYLAIAALRGKDPEGIHDARKAIKRLRALLDLVHDGLGKDEFKRDDRLLRDAGRRLSSARDSEVVASTLKTLLAEQDNKAAELFAPLQTVLDAEAKAAGEQIRGDQAAVATAIEELVLVDGHVNGWGLSADPDWQTIALKRVYRRARSASADARKSPGAETMHELRKATQELRYSSSILRAASPKLLGKLNSRATALSDLIGLERDLLLLRDAVRERASMLPPSDQDRLEGLIAARRKQLRRKALKRARKLYSDRPRDFAQTLH